MKWLVGVFAALMCMSTQAQEKLNFAIAADSGQSCAWYQGSFNIDGYRRPKDNSKPVVACELIEHVGARCWLSNHGIDGLPATLQMTGAFQDTGDGLITETDAGVIRMRVFCARSKGCFRINVWDINDAVGFSCDMHKFVAPPPKPKAPPPEPPPLLKRPAPEPAKPAEKKVGFSV